MFRVLLPSMLLAILFGAGWARPATPAHGAAATQQARDAAAGSTPAERCDDLRAEGLRVVQADAEETAYCLVDVPGEESRYVQVLNVPDAGAFAARKAQAAAALDAAGVNLCGVTLWWVRRDDARAGVPLTEQYASPRPCPPRVIAHDPASAQWTDFTARTVAAALEQAERDYGVRPLAPLTVHLHGLRPAYAARVAAAQGSIASHARLADTAGVAARGVTEGLWIALDTSRFSPAWPEQAAFTIRHEIAHYVQTVAAGCACAFPVWFAEGMADVTAAAATGPITTRFLAARAAEREGRALPLRELDTYPAEAATAALYERGYAAVSYLVERWGTAALGEPLRRNRNGDIASFDAALAAVTGMSVEELDHAVGRWLASGVPEGRAAGRMLPRFVGAYRLYDPEAGRTDGPASVFAAGAAQIDAVAAWDCAPGAHRVVTRWYRPDGALFQEDSAGGEGLRCPVTTRSRLSLSARGRTGGLPADTPGRWRVEITADGRAAATLDLVIGG